MTNTDSLDIEIICLARKNGERYVYLYHPGDEDQTCRVIGRHAARDGLSLTWREAGVLVARIHERRRQWPPGALERILSFVKESLGFKGGN